MLNSDYLALLITFLLSLVWLRINDFTAHKGWINAQLSRKIIHIGTGPIFVLCWLLFPNTSVSRYLAALVPFVITLQFFLVGIGIIRDDAAVEAMSRTGNPREILRGPLYYGIIFVVCTIVFWYDSPIGITALMLLCGGDGVADIMGRYLGRTNIPWSPTKTWLGSLGMFLGGLTLSILLVAIYTGAGIFSPPVLDFIPTIVLISFVATLVETLPIRDIDNITVTASAILLGYFVF
ncbi:MAG: phosphatidate cytidylyltransferase [Chloroflexota bacterium]|nr:MAG: phosphatidate cytidylyltransferase [Chloroflexota bacterium]